MSTGTNQAQVQIVGSKDDKKDRFQCPCGAEVSRRNVTVHEKTAKHLKWQQEQDDKLKGPVQEDQIGPMLREIWESMEELHDRLDEIAEFIGVPEDEASGEEDDN